MVTNEMEFNTASYTLSVYNILQRSICGFPGLNTIKPTSNVSLSSDLEQRSRAITWTNKN